MRLIGAGLPRTATLSQKIALEMLGYGPCYHMVNVLRDLDLTPRWRSALEGSSDELVSLFDGFHATVDWPGAFFYRELMEAYPDAKVLLSVRDGEAWERSMGDTIWGIFYGDILIHDLSSALAKVDPKWAAYIELMMTMWEKSGLLGSERQGAGSGYMAVTMKSYNEEVRRTVPPERLLVWSPADGWGPLCEFLGAPVPDAPFPHVNDSQGFAERIIDASLATLGQWRAQQVEAAKTR
jgi:hypothetical protein